MPPATKAVTVMSDTWQGEMSTGSGVAFFWPGSVTRIKAGVLHLPDESNPIVTPSDTCPDGATVIGVAPGS